MTEHALEPSAQFPAPPGASEVPRPPAPQPAGEVDPAPSHDAASAPPAPDPRVGGADGPASCTQAQLRRFIKSRPYVPLHELRRRFGLNGPDDDVAPVDLDGRRLFVGLPGREAGLLGELLRQGDVGYELLLDPTSPVIIGVFPMRPVQRA